MKNYFQKLAKNDLSKTVKHIFWRSKVCGHALFSVTDLRLEVPEKRKAFLIPNKISTGKRINSVKNPHEKLHVHRKVW